MRYKELRDIFSRTPFQPVTVKFESGESVVVTHPENVIIMDWYIVIGLKDDYIISEPEKVTSVMVRRSSNGNGRR